MYSKDLAGRNFLYVYGEERSFSSVIKNTFYTSKSTVKMTWDSLIDLFRGRYGIEQLSGPVGITGAITEAAKTDTEMLFYLIAVIGMNLGVFNLLPIPALDGGRLFFQIIEAIRGKPIAPEKEGIITMVGFILLMALMVFVMFNDIQKLFVG